MKDLLKFKLLGMPAVLGMFLIISSCEEPLDPKIIAAEETESLLRSYEWGLEDFVVEISKQGIPDPLLIGAAENGLLQEGIYNSAQIFGRLDDYTQWRYRFDDQNKLNIDSTGSGNFEQIGSYKVLGTERIRISFGDTIKNNYLYQYFPGEKIMTFNADFGPAGVIVDGYNNLIRRAVLNDAPSRIGDNVARILFENDTIKSILNDFLVDVISGKIAFINEIDAESAADSAARVIFRAVEDVNWQKILRDKLKEELDRLLDFDSEVVAGQITDLVVAKINELFTEETIFEFVLPFMTQVGEQPPEQVAERIATILVGIIIDVFDEERLQQIIFPIWQDFTKLDSATVSQVSDSLAAIVERNTLNVDSLGARFLPLAEKIDSTPTLQLGQLAQEMTDSLEVTINSINDRFPELNLDPNYDLIQSALTAGLGVIKTKLVSPGYGPQDAADEIAGIILTFVNREFVAEAFFSAIQFLQSINPAIASETIAIWLANLIGQAEEDLIEFLTTKLSPILQNFNPELAAQRVAKAVNTFVTQNVTGDFIFGVIQPVLESISNANTSVVAAFLSKVILESNIIKDNVTEENLAQLLVPVFEEIKDADTKEVADSIIQLLINSQLFKDNVSQERVSGVITFRLYLLLFDVAREINSVQNVTLAFEHE